MPDNVGSVLVKNKKKKKKTEENQLFSHGGQRQSMVCQANLRSHVRRHVLAIHLLWYTDPTAACWGCECHVRDISRHLAVTERERTGIRNFSGIFSKYFDLESVSFLLEFVLSNQLFSSHQATFDFAQTHLLQRLCTSF